jgi:hypothetical protein
VEVQDRVGKPRKIPTKDGLPPTFQKDRLQEAPEHTPELFWLNEEDHLEIEFNVFGPLVPSAILVNHSPILN